MVKISRVGNWLTAVFTLSVICCLGCGHEPTLTEQIQQNFDNGNWEATVTACEQMLQKEPDNPQILTMRGRAHVANGQPQMAIADFTRVIELRPDDPEGYYHREIAYRRAGKSELAEIDGRRGRDLDPVYKSAYAFEPSNFRSTSLLPSSAAKSGSNPYVEPIYADEASFQANDETSRLLAEDTNAESTEIETLESRVVPDIGIPQAPKIDRTELIPKLASTANDETNEADGQARAGDETADTEEIEPPPQPLSDAPNNPDFPDVETPLVNPPPRLSTSLPTGPAGNMIYNLGAPPTGLIGTGLPTARTSSGATGSMSLPLTPYHPQLGISGLPLPKGSTGLPVFSTPITMGQPVEPLIPPGQRTQFHANPFYTPGTARPPQLSNAVPDFESPNPLLNRPAPPPTAPAVPTPISTALPDTVLENKLSPAPKSPPAKPSYRSIQPQ